jgi:hypothetical protein
MSLEHTKSVLRTNQLRLLNYSAFLWIVVVNMVFIVKYAGRTTSLLIGGLSALIYAGVMTVLYQKFDTYINKQVQAVSKQQQSNRSSHYWKVLLLLIVIVWLVLLYLIPKETLRVDRWLMVQTFWDNLRSGVYPYIPRYNQNIPSQLPAYHILAYPFYALGEVGLLSVSVFTGFIFFLSKKLQTITTSIRATQILGILLIMIMILPAFWWEAGTRSTIIINSVLGVIAAGIILHVRANNHWFRYVIVSGLLCGVLCSTRISMTFPMIIAVMYSVRKQGNHRAIQSIEFTRLFIIGIIAVAVVLLCTLPLYFWKPEDALRYNPLTVQSQFAPLWFSLLLLGISIGAGLKANSKFDIYMLSGLVLVIMVIPHLITMLFQYGWEFTLFGNAFDISYLLQPLPYFWFAWCMYQAENTTLRNTISSIE